MPRGMVEGEMNKLLDRIQESPFKGAWRATAVVTISTTVIAGALMRLTDPDTFPDIWHGLWWSAQTVTTVGYGDELPQSAAGRLLAVIVMMAGVTFITVTSAAIASAFVEAARRRRALEDVAGPNLAAEVRELAEEVRRLREEIEQTRAGGTPPPPDEG